MPEQVKAEQKPIEKKRNSNSPIKDHNIKKTTKMFYGI